MSKAKYYIYRNLHTKGFSVKYKGIVIARDDYFIGENVVFKVSEAGRQRVLVEKTKNVHAYAVCDKYSSAGSNEEIDINRIVSYNPYTAAHFVCDNKKIENAEQVIFAKGKCYLLK